LLLEELRDRITFYLLQHNVCVVSTSGTVGAWAMPVSYSSHDLLMECLLPRWADVGYHIENDPRVLLIIWDSSLRWLQYWGIAHLAPTPNWTRPPPASGPNDRYIVIRVEPQRIDLVDESKSWGARETLDF
jgi:hypothetical protein